jgi:hypothetical protein
MDGKSREVTEGDAPGEEDDADVSKTLAAANRMMTSLKKSLVIITTRLDL